jgi:hypothetical protein
MNTVHCSNVLMQFYADNDPGNMVILPFMALYVHISAYYLGIISNRLILFAIRMRDAKTTT